MLILWILLGALLLFLSFSFGIGLWLSEAGYTGPKSSHFDGKKFHNPSGLAAKGLKDVFRYLPESLKRDPWTFKHFATASPDELDQVSPDKIRYCFINHSSFLIQIEGVNILTDPIWSDRCSPFQWSGPKRMSNPGINKEDLPRIDVVLISHNHYDHLDKASIRFLAEKHNPLFITTLGVSHLLKKYGAENCVEIDWWQKHTFGPIRFTATPSNHFSSRGILDRDKTLWCGFTINSSTKNLYFLGDSGYSEIFQEIGNRLGPFDLSFIPIGAYLPRWFMSPIHISPEESAQVHLDVKSKKSVAMHFGCFPLANDNEARATDELRKALVAKNIKVEDFVIPTQGSIFHQSR